MKKTSIYFINKIKFYIPQRQTKVCKNTNLPSRLRDYQQYIGPNCTKAMEIAGGLRYT
jgi:hypothetical protein